MVLSDRSIKEAIDAGRIIIDPLGDECIQPSSVDLHIDHPVSYTHLTLPTNREV